MTNLFAKQSSKIDAGQVLSGVANRELTLRVAAGQVWITIEGSNRDYWLSAGASLQIAPGRLVVIEADRLDSRITIPDMAGNQGRFRAYCRDLMQRLLRNGKALPH